MARETIIGWQKSRWLFAAALSLLGMAAIFATALAGTASAKPKLELKSFQSDRTIQPGQTSALKISCGKGFNFLSTRFRTTTLPSDPSNPATRPAVELLGMVPGEKETKLTLKNVGAVPATVRGTVDCTRVKGKIASRSGDAEAAAKKKKPKLTTYVREKTKKVSGGNRAGAAKTTTLKVTCDKNNSIPADIGFKSNSSEFAGASYFKNKGELGVKGRFNTTGADKLKLYAACTKGKQVTLKGKVVKGTLSSAVAAPKAKASAKKPKLTVSYGEEEGTLEPDVPFTGALRVLGANAADAWSPSFPTSLQPGDQWMGRGFLDSTSLPRSVGDMQRGDDLIIREADFAFLFFGPGVEDFFAITRSSGSIIRNAEGIVVGPPEPSGGEKAVVIDFDDENCVPGFFVDVYIPADAANPTHGLFNTSQPCPETMTVESDVFEAGDEPPQSQGDGWKTKKTYRVTIFSTTAAIPEKSTLRVFWD